jgi:hypothetical protein
MRKWYLLVKDDCSPDQSILVCTDVGKITSVCFIHEPINEDNLDGVPYVSGIVVADSLKIPIRQKISAILVHHGIMCSCSRKRLFDMLPEQVPIVHSYPRRGTDQIGSEVIDKSDLKKAYYCCSGGSNYVLADPRIIWMSFYAKGNDYWLTAKMCADVPTMEKAVAMLKCFGLNVPYSPSGERTVKVWWKANRIWEHFLLQSHEELAQEVWGKRVSFEKAEIMPDKKRDKFVKNLRVVGSFAIPDFDVIMIGLKVDMRAKLVREPNNPHDFNAIRVEAPCSGGSKLGYIPRDAAAVFAREIDSGIAYEAWISSIDMEKRQVFINIFKHVQFPIDNVTGIRFIQNGYKEQQIMFDLSILERKLTYKKRDSWGDTLEQCVEMTFDSESWDGILNHLRKCNLPGWHHSYNKYDYRGSLFWELEIKRRKAPRILISGCAEYPAEWDTFLEFISACLCVENLKGTGRIFQSTFELPMQVVQAEKLARTTKLELEQHDLQIELKDVRRLIRSDMETRDEDGELETDKRRKNAIEERLKTIKKELKQQTDVFKRERKTRGSK